MKTEFAFTDRRHHEYKLVEVDEDRQNLLVGILYGPRHKISASATLSTTVLALPSASDGSRPEAFFGMASGACPTSMGSKGIEDRRAGKCGLIRCMITTPGRLCPLYYFFRVKKPRIASAAACG
jgi:hypothetical protein